MSSLTNITVHDFKSIRFFGVTDYCILAVLLIVSAMIGVFFAPSKKNEKFFNEYILGGKKMKAIPVGISIAASGISAFSLVSVPAEVYIDNAMYILIVISVPIISLLMAYLFLPMYFELEINSVFEYIELRFDSKMRKITSFLYTASAIIWLPAIIYVPALTMSQATGINVYLIAVGVSAVCIFYTTLGGVKAVIWTDFLQMLITLITFLFIIIIATFKSGGFSHIMEVSQNAGKLDIFNMDLSPFQRSSFWINTIGIVVTWTTGIISNQLYVQKFVALPSLHDTKIAMFIYTISNIFMAIIGVYAGLVTFSAYYGCDLIANNVVSHSDQVFPYLVMDKVGHIPTLSGFFIAGVLSAGLSTQSGILNTVSGTIYQDYIQKEGTSEKRAKIIIMSLVVILGTISTLMVIPIGSMENMLSVGYKITSFTGVPIASFFLFGATIPQMNSKGALWGSFVSILALLWITIGSSRSQVHHPKPIYPGIPNTCGLPGDNSSYILDETYVNLEENKEESDVFILYKLSFMYYHVFGLLVSLVVGLIISYITGPTDLSTLNPKLIIPQLRRFLPKHKNVKCSETEMKLIKTTEK